MNIATLVFSLCLVGPANNSATAEVPKDLRIELPRDVRIILFGVPSSKEAKAAEENLRKALEAYEVAQAQPKPDNSKLMHDQARVCFRLGKFDQTLAALVNKMRELERFKGQEAYQQLARELERRSEPLAMYCGDSAAPTVEEDGADEAAERTPTEITKALKADLAEIDDTLAKIDEQAMPDEERKAQLEREIGSLGQFAVQLKSFVDELKVVPADGTREVRVDFGEITQGVQNLIDTLREAKQRRELEEQQGLRPPRQQRRQNRTRGNPEQSYPPKQPPL